LLLELELLDELLEQLDDDELEDELERSVPKKSKLLLELLLELEHELLTIGAKGSERSAPQPCKIIAASEHISSVKNLCD